MTKHRYWSILLALLAFTLTAKSNAGNWEEPTPRLQSEIIVDDTTYVYNIETGQFLTKGGAWGSHAAIGSEGFPYIITAQEEGYQLFSPLAGSTGLLGRASESNVYTDYNNQTTWAINWDITIDSTTGYYRITTIQSDPNWGADVEEGIYASYQLGWDPDAEDLTNGNGASMGTNVGLYMLDPTIEGLSLDWGFVTLADYTTYKQRINLYNALNKAEEAGVGTSEAEKVYNNMDASVDEILTAINALYERINADVTDFMKGATADNPVDATILIENPSFDEVTTDGWVNSGFTAKNNKVWSNEEENVSLENFAEVWVSSSNTCADSDLGQTLEGLPAGKYVLAVDALADRQSKTTLDVSGVSLYANGVTNNSKRIYTHNDKPEHFELEFVHGGGNLAIGVNISSTDANFVVVDNFTLVYYGASEESAQAMELRSTMRNASKYTDEETYIYSRATNEAFGKMLSDAEGLLTSGASDDVLSQMNADLEAMLDQVREEMDAYRTLLALVNQTAEDTERYANYSSMSDKIADLHDLYNTAYEERTYSIEQINQAKESYEEIIVAEIRAIMSNATEDSPVDITALYSNMAYETNTDEGWTHQSASGNWTVRAHVAEVYMSTFDCHRTISGLPAGKYIVSVEGFFRNGTSAEDYDLHINEEYETNGFLYANGKETMLPLCSTGVQSEKLSGYTEVGDGAYIPNSMEAAEIAFGLDDRYLTEVAAAVVKDGGDLTFGTKVDGGIKSGSWTCWSNFRITYCGPNSDVLRDALQDLMTQADDLPSSVTAVAEASKKIDEAMTAADAALNGDDDKAVSKAIDQLTEAIEYATPIPDLIDKLVATVEHYDELLNAVEIEEYDPNYDKLIEEVYECISEESFESVEQIEGMITRLATGWTANVQYGVLNTSSEENPGDITAVIYNAAFEDPVTGIVGSEGWTLSYSGNAGGSEDQRTSSTCWEFWNSITFDIHQTIRGLANGYYRLECNAFFRPTSTTSDCAKAYLENPDSALNALLYVESTRGSYTQPIQNMMVGRQTEPIEVDGEGNTMMDDVKVYFPNTMVSGRAYFDEGFYPKNTLEFEIVDGETITLGIKKETGVAGDWCLMDDFALYYLGTSAPTGVETIEQKQNVQTASRAIYDLQGRRVAHPTQRGIYVISGRKVIK